MGATAAFGPAHVVPPAPELPQRSTTQIVPSGAVVTLAVDPHLRPDGSCPQSSPAWYGFGRSLRAPSRDTAGSETGYCPGGKIGCAPRPVAAGGFAGTPHEYAAGPAGESPGGVGTATVFCAALPAPTPAPSIRTKTTARKPMPNLLSRRVTLRRFLRRDNTTY